MKWVMWLWDRKWYVLLLLVAIFAICVGSGDWGVELMRSQMNLANEKGKARNLKITHGADEASRQIREEHKEELDAIDDEQRAKVDRLDGDPVALSAELARIGRERKRRRLAERADAEG